MITYIHNSLGNSTQQHRWSDDKNIRLTIIHFQKIWPYCSCCNGITLAASQIQGYFLKCVPWRLNVSRDISLQDVNKNKKIFLKKLFGFFCTKPKNVMPRASMLLSLPALYSRPHKASRCHISLLFCETTCTIGSGSVHFVEFKIPSHTTINACGRSGAYLYVQMCGCLHVQTLLRWKSILY